MVRGVLPPDLKVTAGLPIAVVAVPVIDRYIQALGKHQAEAIVLKEGKAVEMVIQGSARPASSKMAERQQIERLLQEAFGDAWAMQDTGPRKNTAAPPAASTCGSKPRKTA